MEAPTLDTIPEEARAAVEATAKALGITAAELFTAMVDNMLDFLKMEAEEEEAEDAEDSTVGDNAFNAADVAAKARAAQ